MCYLNAIFDTTNCANLKLHHHTHCNNYAKPFIPHNRIHNTPLSIHDIKGYYTSYYANMLLEIAVSHKSCAQYWTDTHSDITV